MHLYLVCLCGRENNIPSSSINSVLWNLNWRTVFAGPSPLSCKLSNIWWLQRKTELPSLVCGSTKSNINLGTVKLSPTITPWNTRKQPVSKILISLSKKKIHTTIQSLPQWLSGKVSAYNAGDMQETWVWSLYWEDLLEKEVATHSSILSWEIPWAEGAWWATVHGVPKSLTQLSITHAHYHPSWDRRAPYQKNKVGMESSWLISYVIYNISALCVTLYCITHTEHNFKCHLLSVRQIVFCK